MTVRLPLRARSLAVIALVIAHGLLLGPEEVPAGGGPDWQWPVAGARTVVEPFVAPAHDYGPGHRGIDIAASDGVVRAPAGGIVAFVGTVVDRPLITIDHGGGLVTTFEPVASSLLAGDALSAGDAIGTVTSGGHTPSGSVHIGLRVHGVYVDPMTMFGPVERAILLPCCDPL